MADQAEVLRNLARRAPRRAAPWQARPVRVWTLSGPSGAGVTHVASRLAIGLARQGARVVLVDADLRSAPYKRRHALHDLAANDLPASDFGIHDVLLARCDLHQALRPGPSGVLIAPTTPDGAVAGAAALSEAAQRRLLQGVRALGAHADLALIDAGSFGEPARIWLDAADETICVCTPRPEDITGIYGHIKQRLAGAAPSPAATTHLAVNRAASFDQGLDAWRRVQTTCLRFLGVEIAWLGSLPETDANSDDRDSALAAAETPEVEAMSLRVLGKCAGKN